MKIDNYYVTYREEASPEGGDGGGGGTLTAPLPGDGGGDNSGDSTGWRSQLSSEFKDNPSLVDYKDTPEGLNHLAKTLIHSQSLIGRDKIAIPNDSSSPEELGAFFKAGGRPDTAGDYKFELPATKSGPLDDTKLEAWKNTFHEAGLSNKAANTIISKFIENTESEFSTNQDQQATNRTQELTELRTDWGDKYDTNVDIAKSAVRKFGDEGLVKWLNDSGNSDNPMFIKMFNKIGQGFLDDVPQGSGNSLFINSSTQAVQEINKLKGDPDFQKRLTNRSEPGHKETKAMWTRLHDEAYNTK